MKKQAFPLKPKQKWFVVNSGKPTLASMTMGKVHSRPIANRWVLFVLVTLVLTSAQMTSVAAPSSLDEMIRAFLAERGAEVQMASSAQLSRRFAIDFTGVVPSTADINQMSGMSPAEMFDYFKAKGPMDHTAGENPFIWSNLLKDADHFLFSNSDQFSQFQHITDFRDQLRRVYTEDLSYLDFARFALKSQMFLNRFPSPADRANAIFFLFLSRDSFSSEVPMGNMWNGYFLESNTDVPSDPLFHVYGYDASRCADGTVLCEASLWAQQGSTPDQGIDIVVASPMFAEAAVNRYWQRYVGATLPGVDFPSIRRYLAEGFVASGYKVNWLIREITTSAAYTQEMMFR